MLKTVWVGMLGLGFLINGCNCDPECEENEINCSNEDSTSNADANEDSTDDDGDPDGADSGGSGGLPGYVTMPNPNCPGCDENRDGDGWCIDIELGYYCCDDGLPASIPADERTSCPDLNRCENETFGEAPYAAKVLLLLDRSGSMNNPMGSGGITRWNALVSSVETAVTVADDAADFALLSFPKNSFGASSPSCNDGFAPFGCVVDNDPHVPFRDASTTESDWERIDAHFFAEPPCDGATPTAEALEKAQAYLESRPASETHAVILVTDGGPGCNSALDATTCQCLESDACNTLDDSGNTLLNPLLCLDDTRSVSRVEAIASNGTPVFVIGLTGSGGFEDLLNELALAGGKALTGPLSYYTSDNANELESALENITDELTSCTVALEAIPSAREDIVVTINGARVNESSSEGWTWESDSALIELHGSACDSAIEYGSDVSFEACAIEFGPGL